MVGVGPSQAARRLPNPDTPDRVALTELRQCRIIADMDGGPVAVVETREFVRQARLIFSADETEALTTFIAYNPAAGVVMPGTGGVRKLRWARSGKGKRGRCARDLLFPQQIAAGIPGDRLCKGQAW